MDGSRYRSKTSPDFLTKRVILPVQAAMLPVAVANITEKKQKHI